MSMFLWMHAKNSYEGSEDENGEISSYNGYTFPFVEIDPQPELDHVNIIHVSDLHFGSAINVADIELSEPSRVTCEDVVGTPETLRLTPPLFGEKILLLLLSKEERRANLIGDLEEEYAEIAAKHGEKYAQVWYWKQILTSAWPMIRKAMRWGLIAWVGEWVRRII